MNKPHLIRKDIQEDTQQNLPVLPPGISYLLKILNNDDFGYTQLAIELERFPSIAIKIVATANSAWASPGTPITTLRDSCARIGVKVVRSISIALSIAQVFDPSRCPSFDSKKFWVSSLLTAEAANICAKDNPDICAETARLAGLLHNIGLLWLVTLQAQQVEQAISFRKSQQQCSLSESLFEVLGIDLYSAGGELASYIELPEIFETLISSPAVNPAAVNQDDAEPLIQNHQYAIRLAAAVVSFTENETEDIGEFENNPHFMELANKLPDIKSLAQALFF